MYLCSNNHDEVCFEGRKCPACNMREDLQDSIGELKTENASLKADFEALQFSISGLEEAKP
jgi:hypothetical protein